jgi:beta-xylosidase
MCLLKRAINKNVLVWLTIDIMIKFEKNKMKKFLRSLVLIIVQSIYITVIAQDKQARNPVIFADVPAMSMIGVGDTYYMSSTTIHMSPGVPIMESNDLVNWQLINYVYDTLISNDEMNLDNGKSAYGRGSWVSSIRYHNGTYYVSTFAVTSGKTHIYITKNIEMIGHMQNQFLENTIRFYTLQ